jgi:hypothetical protein
MLTQQLAIAQLFATLNTPTKIAVAHYIRAHHTQATLQGMLSMTPAARPNAAAFASCQFFQEDMLLRCLKFLDTMLQRDTGQKVRLGTAQLDAQRSTARHSQR